jgi:hypothetical protein
MSKENKATLVAHCIQTVEDVLDSGLIPRINEAVSIHLAMPLSAVKSEPFCDYSLSNIKRLAIKNGVKEITFSCKTNLLAE